MLKLLLECGPIVIFFATYKSADIFKATLLMVITTCISLCISYMIDKKISLPLLISGIILLISGILTLVIGDPKYIKMKPTIVYIIFGFALYIGYVKKQPLMKPILSSVWQMDDYHWLVFSMRFAYYFFSMALVNEYVWRNYSEKHWVNFKVFGMLPITLVFLLIQLPFLLRNQKKS